MNVKLSTLEKAGLIESLERRKIFFWLIGLISKCIEYVVYTGFEQHVYVANVPNEHDGPADNHGPIAARRRPDGGKDYVCHVDVQEG